MIDVAETFRDQRLHGFTTTEVCDVINAWASTGYGNPDSDCDGTADGVNDDGDGDGVRDGTDNCVLVPNIAQDDTDGDGDGDACDPDDDGDGVDDRDDNCPKDPNGLQQDDDNDGEGDACENDNDRDGVDDPDDNCTFTANGECSFLVDRLCDIDGDGTTTDEEARKGYQRDTDGDGNGDACDGDLDGDDIPNSSDACPFTASSINSDGDEDGVGDPCDNCSESPNPDQADLDQDGTGDICDPDPDGDELIGENDNCPETYNPDQADNDKNGVGLWCDGGELAYLNGIKREGDLALLFEFRDPLEPVVLPLFPCEEDCPDWIPATYKMRVEMRTDPGLNMRIVDTDGRVIAHSRVPEDGVHDLTFRVRPEYSYTSPATGGEVPYQDDQALQRMQAVGYRLELYLPPESPAGVSGDLLVTTIPE
jgi:hypothetical protein